jgi:cysteinyl-tRNA synthetase
MTVTLYNTLTRRKDALEPIHPGTVGLYTCGPTVYNYAHIGNLRTYVFEDILKRVLLEAGLQVTHVMNVTDVGHLTDDADAGEDKMALGAQREGKTVWEIADFYWQAFRDDIAKLNILEPDVWCKATDHIAEQIDLVKALEDKGYTYVIDDGVYFDTSKLDDYGKLARLDVEGLQAGARVEMAAGKRNATDFALWKFSPKNAQRLMEWDSPWGVGFPGWHIECSAMAMKYLPDGLDIHCGGIDHVAVHHTNEIAQSESALDGKWCNVWLHGEFLTFVRPDGDDGKMSKSSGEFLTLERLTSKGYPALAYRLFLLGAHYRQQLAFTDEAMTAAANAFDRLQRSVIELKSTVDAPGTPIASHMDAFLASAFDDLNMPRCLAEMWAVLKNTAATPADRYATLLAMDAILGFGFDTMQADDGSSDPEAEEIQALLDERAAAKKDKDFARADDIRDELTARGIEIKDTPDGATWRRK